MGLEKDNIISNSWVILWYPFFILGGGGDLRYPQVGNLPYQVIKLSYLMIPSHWIISTSHMVVRLLCWVVLISFNHNFPCFWRLCVLCVQV